MRRSIESVSRTTLCVLLFAGCADNDAGPGFSATQGATGTEGAMSMTTGTSGTFGAEDSTGAPTSTSTTSAVTASSDGLPMSTGMEDGTTGAVGPGETDGTDTAGSTGTTGTTGTTGEGGTTGEVGPSFAVDIWPIFDDNCSCHEDANGAGKLRLAMEDAYENLIDKPAYQLPEMMLVKSDGTAQDSYLWHKLNNTHKDVGGKGKKMPPGGLLDMADLDLIQQWLDAGAKP